MLTTYSFFFFFFFFFFFVLQEHKCVLDSCRALEAEGFDITYLPVKNTGLICLEVFEFCVYSYYCTVKPVLSGHPGDHKLVSR
jgi:hypothetical protein